MSKLTRRKLIAGTAVASLSVKGATREAPTKSGGSKGIWTSPSVRASKYDPVLAKTAVWIAQREAVDAMMRDWQDLEAALNRRKPAAMTLTQAYRCGLPEARAMRELDRRIKSALRRLDRTARAVVLLRSASAKGALAKITMGVRIQGPYDWEDYAFALIQDGCEQLTLLLAQEG